MRSVEDRPIRAIGLLIGALLSACHHGSSDQSAYMRKIKMPTPRSTVGPWPSYLAESYRTFHKRTLTHDELALIRKTLSLATSCQEPNLRFAFPVDGGKDFPFVLFIQRSYPLVEAHALWTKNMYYQPQDGTILALPGENPEWSGTSEEFGQVGCNGA